MQGQLISDRYRLVRLLGKGGMGSVWLAEHTALKNEVAVKLIGSDLGNVPNLRARFLREAQLAARIKSTHVVQVYDYGVSGDDQPYIAMEYLSGVTLRDRLDSAGRLSRGETARVVSHVCRALARAHEAGLIHRDLKPENIFLAQEGGDEIVKVLDFGVAKAADVLADSGIDPTRTGALVGTPFYMSPEQAQGLKTIDHRADLWGLGIVVYECLTGVRPFVADALGPLIARILAFPIAPPSTVSPDVTPEIDAWMARALSRDPAGRFASAQELSESFMIAAGTTESFRTDRGSVDPKVPVQEATYKASMAPTVLDGSSNLALAHTVQSEPPKAGASAPPVTVAPVVVPSRTPLIIAVLVLSALVMVLGAMLLLRR